MTLRALLKACLACFQGDIAVPVTYYQDRKPSADLKLQLATERDHLIRERARLRRNKKRHTHLDPRLQEITTELLRLEKGI